MSPITRTDRSYGRFEPANKADLALMLLRKAFAWARAVDPQAAPDRRCLVRRPLQPRTALANQSIHARAIGCDQLS